MLPYSLGSEETWDVEEMKRTKLFTDDKCRYIIRERREYDFKINGISKCLNDFKEYIIFEKTLLKELHSQVGNKRDAREARNSIELKIMKKIRRIYETAMLWFTNDFQLHLSYFQFCKQIKNYSGAAATLQKMIKNFDHNAEVWRVAANWHAHDQNNISAARTVLLKGISLHKNSEVLYTEAIKLELSVVKGDQNSSEEVNALKEQVYKKIEECIRLIDDCTNDPKYFIEALHLLENYSFTSGLQFEIVEKLCLKYSKKGIVWHTLAQRAKRGVETGYSKEDRLNTCLKLYGEGLRKVSREDKPGLWTSYLDCLFEAKAENDIFVKIIKNALEHASDEDCLAEKYYIEWLNLLSSDEKALDILKKGTSAFPKSKDLWLLRLQYACNISLEDKVQGFLREVESAFTEGVKHLKENSLPLWLLYLRHHCLIHKKDDVINSIFVSAVEQPKEISQIFKPKYLEWLYTTKGIEEVRAMYGILAFARPFCKELHTTMAKFESLEFEVNLESWSNVCQLACDQFGDNDSDVWIDKVLFYIQYYSYETALEKVHDTKNEAFQKLNLFLQDDFIDKFTKHCKNLNFSQ